MYKTITRAMQLLTVFIVSATIYSCTSSVASSTSTEFFSQDHLEPQLNEDIILYKNLQLYPIYAKDGESDFGNYVPLNTAIQSKKIEISEKGIVDSGGGDEVNKLFIENKSADTIFLMAGEVVKGGKQDRTLATDVVLAPGSGKKDVEVFCVEQNRWSTKDENIEVNKPKEEMKFKCTAPVVKNSVRKMATVEKEQNKVWNEVTVANDKASVQSATNAYTAIENNVDYQKEEKEYTRQLQHLLKSDKKILGFVAVTGNRIIGCDIFATHHLFVQSLESILPSYINEAIHDGSKPNIQQQVVTKYIDVLLKDQKTQSDYLTKNGKLYKYNNRAYHLNAY